MAKEAPSFIISIRFLLAILAFVAYAAQYTQKINMSVAIVCMVNHTAANSHSTHQNETFSTFNQSIDTSGCGSYQSKKSSGLNGEFNWDKNTQGLILASYFVGYLITEIPGGWLSLKFGSKIVLALAILIASILTIILPFAARIHYTLLILSRFLIGAAHVTIIFLILILIYY